MSAIKQTLITLAEVDLDKLSQKELKKHCVRCIIIAQKTVLDSQRVELSDEMKYMRDNLEWIIHHADQEGVTKAVLKSVAKQALRDKQPTEQVDLEGFSSVVEFLNTQSVDLKLNKSELESEFGFYKEYLKTKEG